MLIGKGDCIGGYTVIQECGRGAYGSVFLVEDKLGRRLALKVVWIADDHTAWKRELEGLKAYAKTITSPIPGLVQIFHVDEEKEFFYYTMDLADNASEVLGAYEAMSLSWLIKSKSLQKSEICLVAHQLLDAVEYMHGCGLTHRDIKPDNIIRVKGAMKLGDIGLVTLKENSTMVGTPHFIPPEKINQPTSLDAADDLYALGKTLYCLFTGLSAEQYPSFPGHATFSDQSRMMNGVIVRMCSNEPSERLKDIDQIRATLSSISEVIVKKESKKSRVDELVGYLYVNDHWDSGMFDHFLRHMQPEHRQKLKETLGIAVDRKYSTISMEELAIKKKLLWHYSSFMTFPLKPNEVPYHDLVKWIAEKHGANEEQLNNYSTFQLECCIARTLFSSVKGESINGFCCVGVGSYYDYFGMVASSIKSAERLFKTIADVAPNIFSLNADVRIVEKAIICIYAIKHQVISKNYKKLPERPIFPSECMLNKPTSDQ